MNRPLSLVLLAFPIALPIAALPSQSTFGLPVEVLHNRPPEPNVNAVGGVFTPDGRVLLYSDIYIPGSYTNLQSGGWFARILRHENITASSAGVPAFSSGAWSASLRFAFDEFPPAWGMTPLHPYDGHVIHGWLTAGPDPAFAKLPVPFRSDSSGGSSPQGAFETYRLCIVAPTWWPLANGVPINLANPTFVAFGATPALTYPMAVRRVQVVVAAPRTANASIHSVAFLDAAPNFLTYTVGSAQYPIVGIEPSITMDGRLLLFQGNPLNNANAMPGTVLDRVMYSYNNTPFATTGWSQPRMLSEMHSNDAAKIIAGRRFDERYPIAKNALIDAENAPIQGEYWGAYPWISLDGTDVVHTTLRVTGSSTPPIRAGLAMIGQSTGWKLQYIDGPLNKDRVTTERLIFTGTGVSPGIWSPARDMLSPPLPYSRSGQSFPLLGINPPVYGEVAVDERLDGDYVVALPMSEVIAADPQHTAIWHMDTQKTADLASSTQVGILENGASFPQDLSSSAPDQNGGVIGQAVSFDDNARVRVATAAGSPAQVAKSAMTVELFLKDPSIQTGSTSGRFHLCANQPFSWFVGIQENGRVVWFVYTAAGLQNGSTVALVAPNTWTHLAMTYRTGVAADTMQLFVNGIADPPLTLPGSGTVGIAPALGDLAIGPDGFHVPLVGSYIGRILIDEFKYSRVVRTEAEIARHARKVPGSTTWAPSPALPVGLDGAATRIPATHPFNAAAVNLGSLLFHDTNLSTNGMSCATCHQDGRDFTDGLPRGIGHQGLVLPRNTPTIVNRIFSTRQFLDGRAATLEEQALLPINNPDEMRSSTSQVVAYLQATPAYQTLFGQVYSAPPSATNLAQALASYQRAVVSGKSAFDSHRSGGAPLSGAALTGHDLFFGKARCFACHFGTNLSDEDFHVTLVNDADEGRGGVTGRVLDSHRFKTPTLRNVANTGPYFHDGSAATLTDVVNLYNIGGARPVADPEVHPLGLTSTEVSNLVAFLNALTGQVTTLQP